MKLSSLFPGGNWSSSAWSRFIQSSFIIQMFEPESDEELNIEEDSRTLTFHQTAAFVCLYSFWYLNGGRYTQIDVRRCL